jgi:uncharacterized OsmC-like protein
MEVLIRRRSGKELEASARFHRLLCDRPHAEGGDDCGMTASELMLSALGCCAMFSASAYLQARYLTLDNIEVRVSATRGGRPARLTEIGIEVEAPGLSVKRRDGLMRALEACVLHQTLAHASKVKISLKTEAPVDLEA